MSFQVVAGEDALVADVEHAAAHHRMGPAGISLIGDPESPLLAIGFRRRLGKADSVVFAQQVVHGTARLAVP